MPDIIYICDDCWIEGEELTIGGILGDFAAYTCAVCGGKFSRVKTHAIYEDSRIKARKIQPNETFDVKITWPGEAPVVKVVMIGLEGDPEVLDDIEKAIKNKELKLDIKPGTFQYEIDTSEAKPDWAKYSCGTFDDNHNPLFEIWTDVLCSSCGHPPCPHFESCCDYGQCLFSESENESDCMGDCRLPSKPRFWAEIVKKDD